MCYVLNEVTDMPSPVLYVLPEDHANQQDQERKIALNDLASFGAINVLLENCYFHDTSARYRNVYGIEEEKSHKRAVLILNYTNAANLPLYYSNRPQFDDNLKSARAKALQEVTTLEQQGSLPKPVLKQELTRFISNWPNQREAEIEEKYIFYKRNHKISENIKNIVQSVLADPNKPRVFALSIGAKHLDSTNLNPSIKYQGRKDLPTILGNTITSGSHTVQVIYGTQSPVTVQTIAKKALELSDNLPWTTQARLNFFIATGL